MPNLIRLAQAALAAPPRFRLRRCVLCGHRVGRFLPYPGGMEAVPALMAALHTVGSDVLNYECPRCGSTDRERHLLFYMRASGDLDRIEGADVLHVAPERRLSPVLQGRRPARYLACDLLPSRPGIERVDVTSMTFEDGCFDLVIANHVLEHVDDDLAAIAEISRVLRRGGIAILQTPYSPGLFRTWADSGIVSDAARTQAFGQADHVRLYGRDVFERIATAGLQADIRTHAVLLHDVDAAQTGVNPREPYMRFVKLA